jgi:hypothetical protein
MKILQTNTLKVGLNVSQSLSTKLQLRPSHILCSYAQSQFNSLIDELTTVFQYSFLLLMIASHIFVCDFLCVRDIQR